MKKLALVLTLVLCFSFSGFAYENAVFDDADLFYDYEEEQIVSELLEFSDLTDYSLAVVTTDDALGKSAEEYADDYLDDLIDSKGWQESSMLFLIDMDNREVYVSTAGDCVAWYDSDFCYDIIDSGYSDLSNGNYSSAIITMIDYATLINPCDDGYYDDGYNYNYYDFDYDYDSYEAPDTFTANDFLIYLVVGLAAGGIAVFAVMNSYKNQGKGDEFGSSDIQLNLTASNDTVISRNVITTKIPKNNNHRGSGGISGGGVHRSSAGRTHGGGGRKF